VANKSVFMRRLQVTLALFLSVASTCQLHAAAIAVTSFNQVADNQFVNINPVMIGPPVPAPISIGQLTITSGTIDPGAQFGDFLGLAPGSTNDPGDGSGRAFATQDYRVNFNLPLAAFGVTFYHAAADNGMDFPAILRVYDGPNGTGSLIGTVTSSGSLVLPARDDFVGVWSDSHNIRSAVMFGTSDYRGILVDAYGFSFTPVPEPSPMLLVALATFGWWSWRAYKAKAHAAK
jgi:hypothetical protein